MLMPHPSSRRAGRTASPVPMSRPPRLPRLLHPAGQPALRGQAPRVLLALLFAVALAVTGCVRGPGTLAPDPTRPAAERIIPDVPFFAQEQYQCGPASLAGVLRHLGLDGSQATPEGIAETIFRPGMHGTLSLDLALYPRTLGLASRWYDGSVADLMAAVDSGQPRIVMVDHGYGLVSSYHFMVVVGYAPDAVIVNSDRTPLQRLPWASFLRTWDRTDRWTLEVRRQ
ncbi:C39 family peptidase [Nitratidesulfovibrio sp. HK-II]